MSSNTTITITKEKPIKQIELRAVVPVMLEVCSHSKAQIDLSIEFITGVVVEEVHTWYADEF